ncbi:unnamed protein product [Cyprideis torosa]|uniref:Membrane-bound transcription factor site-2 protease n=1 Tax=Cyprideis torosa TaxID=163714 RepID=A0A7R8ZGK3_9CRUS|nr:unnamed protein product [Cyprideis torosa]CAG0880246.1 unnamed protein product [Cyprideis torosa]
MLWLNLSMGWVVLVGAICLVHLCVFIGWKKLSHRCPSLSLPAPLTIGWATTALSTPLYVMGVRNLNLWSVWFSLGRLLTVLLLLPTCFLLVQSAAKPFLTWIISWLIPSLSPSVEQVEKDPLFIPAIPGLTFPWQHAWQIFLALLIASCLHEVGHALAAACKKVRSSSVGVMLIFCLPTFYVNFPPEPIATLSATDQLSIFCAGIWHNLALSAGAGLLSILASEDTWNVINSIEKRSSLFSELPVGSHLLSMNGCFLEDSRQGFVTCLDDASRRGICWKDDVVRRMATGSESVHSNCCLSSLASTHVCFRNFRARTAQGHSEGVARYVCLPPREMMRKHGTEKFCDLSNRSGLSCGNPSVGCYQTPFADERETADKLFVLEHSQSPKPVLFLGSKAELGHSLSLGSHPTPFLSYLSSLSLTLGLLNLVPCFGLDGQMIVEALVTYLWPSGSPVRRAQVVWWMSLAGTSLLTMTLASALLGIG